MKRYLSLLSLMILAVAACVAQTAGSQRVILKAVRPFTSVAVSGPAVVELRYDARHGGFIVYNTSDNSAPRIVAQSYDGDLLRIEADSTANALTTRVTVLYNQPLMQVDASDRAVVVAKELVGTPNLVLTSATDQAKSGIFVRSIKADNVMLNLVDGDMGIGQLRAKDMMVTGANTSRLLLGKCFATNIEFEATGQSDLSIIGGKVANMMVNVDNMSAVHTLKLRCNSLTVNLMGNGTLNSGPVRRVVVNQLGNGTITMPRYPHEVESNVGPDVVTILK